MTYTYARSSGQLPTPMGPTSLAIGAGGSGPFSTGMTLGVSQNLNQQAAALRLLGQVGGGGYGVASGLDLASVSGLNVAVSPGIAILDGPLELVGASPFGALQVLAPLPLTLLDNSVSFVWLTSNGGLVAGTTMAPPPMAKLFLGTVTTDGGSITGVDYSGRVSAQSGRLQRTTADLWEPADSPPANMHLVTVTQGGSYLWDGISHKALVDPSRQFITPSQTVTISTDLLLTPSSPNITAVNASVAGLFVHLPDPTALTPGHNFTILNTGANPFGIKNSAGAVVTSAVAPDSQVSASPAFKSGALAFPLLLAPLATAS